MRLCLCADALQGEAQISAGLEQYLCLGCCHDDCSNLHQRCKTMDKHLHLMCPHMSPTFENRSFVGDQLPVCDL